MTPLKGFAKQVLDKGENFHLTNFKTQRSVYGVDGEHKYKVPVK